MALPLLLAAPWFCFVVVVRAVRLSHPIRLRFALISAGAQRVGLQRPLRGGLRLHFPRHDPRLAICLDQGHRRAFTQHPTPCLTLALSRK